MQLLALAALIVSMFAGPAFAANEQVPRKGINWTGGFEPCERRSELLKHDHMELGLRMSTSNRMLAKEFRRAMDFWAGVVDMRWYSDQTASCSLQLVDGNPSILTHATVARSQFTDWGNFEGWIAFDPNAPLTRAEMYLTAVHEIGHILGLKHNPDPNSVMYYLDLREREVLDPSDLLALAARHRLRVSVRRPVPVSSAIP